MARGLAINKVTNKIRNVSDGDVLPISTGGTQPEVIEVGVLKNHIKEDIESIEALTNIEIENLLNRNNI